MTWSLESYVVNGVSARPLARGDSIAQHETVMFRLSLPNEGDYPASDPANWAQPPTMRVTGGDGSGGMVIVDVRPSDESILTFYYTFDYTGRKRLYFRGTSGEHSLGTPRRRTAGSPIPL